MYTLPLASSPEIQPGSNLLVRGPPMTGKARLARLIVGSELRRGAHGVVVTADDGAERLLADGQFDATDRLRIVDCISQHQGESVEERPNTEYVSSPADLTGIGMGLSSALETVVEADGAGDVGVLFESISTLLAYREVETVFRFLHVATGRVAAVDGLGLYLAHTGSGDAEDLAKLATLFDGVIETREGDGESEYRLRGVTAEPTEWRAISTIEPVTEGSE